MASLCSHDETESIRHPDAMSSTMWRIPRGDKKKKKSTCIWSVISRCYFTIVTLLFLFPAVQNGLQLLDNCLPAVNQSICSTVGILRRETITFGKRTCARTCFLTNVLCRTRSEYRAGPVRQVGRVERERKFYELSFLTRCINQLLMVCVSAALPFPFLAVTHMRTHTRTRCDFCQPMFSRTWWVICTTPDLILQNISMHLHI